MMVSKGIMIGVVVGVFFAGLGIGYVASQSSTLVSPIMMPSQQMQKQNEDKQTENVPSSYVQMIDGVQVVIIHAKEFKFIPSEININTGKTKFVLINDGEAVHELVVYDISKKDIVDKAELAEDEATIGKNILFEIEEVHPGESGESDVLNLQEGSYVMGCHVPGHYEAGMKGTIEIKS